MSYIKEMFGQFTSQLMGLGDKEFDDHYYKLQSQADKGLLDEQLEGITPHTDLADLFEEFYSINLVNEESSKPLYSERERGEHITIIGGLSYSSMLKNTKLKFIEMNNRVVFSDEAYKVLKSLGESNVFEKLKKSLDPDIDVNDLFASWFSGACVKSVIAVHYRVMHQTGSRTLCDQQSRNIGEILVSSLGFNWTDESYQMLGEIAKTVVILGDLPVDAKLNFDSVFGGSTPAGGNFQATVIPAESSISSFINTEHVPKELCVGTSSFYYFKGEKREQYNDTSETIWGLYWIFGYVRRMNPNAFSQGWLDNAGYSFSKDDN